MEDKQNARNRILKAAAEVFAQKSFDGARVDEIARLAEVPKSLIYYHFSGKDQLLAVLTDDFIEKYRSIVETYRGEENRREATQIGDRMNTIYYPYGVQNENLIRTLLMDSLKCSGDNTALFKLLCVLREDKELDESVKKELVDEFFFNILPCMTYICFAKGFAEYFHMSEQELHHSFMEAYSRNHVAVHLTKQSQEGGGQ